MECKFGCVTTEECGFWELIDTLWNVNNGDIICYLNGAEN